MYEGINRYLPGSDASTSLTVGSIGSGSAQLHRASTSNATGPLGP